MRYLSGQRRLEAAESCVIWFFLYSVLGWLYEVFLEVVVYRWGFTNRGVLFGPYCPVYGVGALVFLLCFSRLMEKREPAWLRWVKPVLIFLGCMAVATAIELATSYILEAITGAWPWQTYRDYAINFEGRIALSPLRPVRAGRAAVPLCAPAPVPASDGEPLPPGCGGAPPSP